MGRRRNKAITVLCLSIALVITDWRPRVFAGGDVPIRATLKGHTRRVSWMEFSPDGKTLATSDGRVLKLWNAETGREKATIRRDHSVGDISFSPDGETVALDAGDEVLLWNVAKREVFKTVPVHEGKEDIVSNIFCLGFSPDGKTLAATVTPAVLILWDTAKWEKRATLRWDQFMARRLTFSPDRKTLAVAIFVGDVDRAVKLVDIKAGKVKDTLPGAPYGTSGLAFSPDGKLLAIADVAEVRLWSLAEDRKQQAQITTPRPKGPYFGITGVGFSPDGKVLAVAIGTEIQFWDTSTWKQLTAVRGHQEIIPGIEFSPDRKTLASVSYDKTAILWDVMAILAAAKKDEQPK